MSLSDAIHFASGASDICDELRKAKTLAPDDSVGLAAFQMAFAQWLSGFLPAPVSAIASATSPVADATIRGFDAAQHNRYTEELVAGVHRILKTHDLRLDDTKDLHILFNDQVATIPKETLRDLNIVQRFVTSAELVYKDLTSTSTTDLFKEIEAHRVSFHTHADAAQNVRVDFVVEPESYLGRVVAEFDKQRKENEGLYKTPRKETTMSATTGTFTTSCPTAGPKASCSNSGGKINFTILLPVLIISIPLGGPGGASFCSIM